MASNRGELWKSLAAFKTGNIEKLLTGETFTLNIGTLLNPDGTSSPVANVNITMKLAESQTQTGGLGYDPQSQPPALAPASAPK